MSRHDRKERERHGPFVAILKETLDSPAWKSMSHGARSLYVALKRLYSTNFRNNGRIYLSQRDAAKAIGSHHNQVCRWFRELQHFGFIVMTTPGSLGVEGKGKAPHWRLTELGYMGDPPSRDFQRWNGESFDGVGKIKTRARKQARGVPESQHTIVPENNHTNGNKCAVKLAHIADAVVPESKHITSLPLPRPRPALSVSPELTQNLRRRGWTAT